jgi:hypothetical protein
VLGFDHRADSLGRQVLLRRVGDLLGRALLNLQVSGEQADNAGQLRQPEDALPGQVTDVGDFVEGQYVVLAQ